MAQEILHRLSEIKTAAETTNHPDWIEAALQLEQLINELVATNHLPLELQPTRVKLGDFSAYREAKAPFLSVEKLRIAAEELSSPSSRQIILDVLRHINLYGNNSIVHVGLEIRILRSLWAKHIYTTDHLKTYVNKPFPIRGIGETNFQIIQLHMMAFEKRSVDYTSPN